MKDLFFNKNRSLLILSLIIMIYLIGVWQVYDYTVDDAFISLRYGENLAAHGQLTYNLGEPPNEGYTNFLLVLTEALFFKLGLGDGVIVVPKLIGVIFGVLTIIFTYLISLNMTKRTNLFVPSFTSLATGLSTPFIVWSAAGLETTLFTGLLTGAVYFHFKYLDTPKNNYALTAELLFFLTILCRPEGLLFWVLAQVHLYSHYKRFPIIPRLKASLAALGLLGLYVSWKLAYFGDILPLTYYAKSSWDISSLLQGLKRFSFFAGINLSYVYLFLFTWSTWYAFRRKDFKLQFILLISVMYFLNVMGLGYSVSMDDCFRLYVPFIPFLYVSAGMVFYYLPLNKYRLTQRFGVLLLITVVIAQLSVGVRDLNTAWYKDYNFGSKSLDKNFSSGVKKVNTQWQTCFGGMGKWLNKNIPSNATVVLPDIGLVGYYSRLKVIDTYSLITPEMVKLINERKLFPVNSQGYHLLNQAMVDYIFDQRPEVIINDRGIGLFKDERINNYRPRATFHWFDKDYKVYVREDL